MRDRSTEIEYLKACAGMVRVRAIDNGFERLVRPPVEHYVEHFIKRTGDGPIREVIIQNGDAEGMEEAVDGGAYPAWRNLYADDTSDYAKSLRAQAIGHAIAMHHLLRMAQEVDEG